MGTWEEAKSNSKCLFCNEELESKNFTDHEFELHANCKYCGKYDIRYTPYRAVPENSNQKFKISYWIRKNQNNNNLPVQLTEDTLSYILDKIPFPSLNERINIILQYIGDHTKYFGHNLKIDQKNLMILTGTSYPKEVNAILDYLINQKFIEQKVNPDGTSYNLGYTGMEKYNELKKTSIASNRAFLAMPYNQNSLDQIVEKYFIPAVNETGFDLYRLDKVLKAGLIDNQLRAEIMSSKFIIAELAEGNNGAYWEAGYAEGLGKPVIYTCEKKYFEKFKTHFDTNHHTTIIWSEETIKDDMEKLKSTIRYTFPLEAKF